MQNHNQIWIFVFFHLVSNDTDVGLKQLVGRNSVLSFCTLSCSTTVCKGNVFLQFCDKIQSSMHQIFTQMHLTIAIGQSHMERPTKSFIKKFFFCFPCNGQPIFPHLNLPPNKKSPQTGTCHFTILPLSSKTIPEDTWSHSLMTNFLSINPPQHKSNHHKHDLLITPNKISHCLLQLQIIKP